MSCCSGKTKHRAHAKWSNECLKVGKAFEKPRFCVSDCTENEECIVCACAKNGAVVAPGVELKLPSVDGATYFWSICSPPHADCTLDSVQGQNCITRSPSLRGLEGPTFDDDGAYKEIKYVGYVLKHEEALLRKVFRVRVYDVTCQPCDYKITPSDCIIDESCTEIIIEYCGSNFGVFDPTESSFRELLEDPASWYLNGTQQSSVPVPQDTFSTQQVLRSKLEKPCQNAFVIGTEIDQNARNRHLLIRIRRENLNFNDGRNVLVFQNTNTQLSLPFFLIKCPAGPPAPAIPTI